MLQWKCGHILSSANLTCKTIGMAVLQPSQCCSKCYLQIRLSCCAMRRNLLKLKLKFTEEGGILVCKLQIVVSIGWCCSCLVDHEHLALLASVRGKRGGWSETWEHLDHPPAFSPQPMTLPCCSRNRLRISCQDCWQIKDGHCCSQQHWKEDLGPGQLWTLIQHKMAMIACFLVFW